MLTWIFKAKVLPSFLCILKVYRKFEMALMETIPF